MSARRARLLKVLWITACVGVGCACLLMAMRQHIELFLTPTQVQTQPHRLQHHQPFRLGGLVVTGSIHQQGLEVHFQVRDWSGSGRIWVRYHGVLPSLFRDGQGVVMLGHLNDHGQFLAQTILAKHNEDYHPPRGRLPRTLG